MTKGRAGEEAAACYLEKNGHKIIERNFRSNRGEVDIITVKNAEIHFIEVKTWDYYSNLDLERAISKDKRQRIIATARFFLYRSPEFETLEPYFDILLQKTSPYRFQWYPDAFGETDFSW